MVEAQDLEGQRTIDVTNMPFLPATVVDHEEHDNGMTLITLDPDSDTDIEIYNDGRTPHRSGEDPEWAE